MHLSDTLLAVQSGGGAKAGHRQQEDELQHAGGGGGGGGTGVWSVSEILNTGNLTGIYIYSLLS